MFFLRAVDACVAMVLRFSSFFPSLGLDWARRTVIGFVSTRLVGIAVFSAYRHASRRVLASTLGFKVTPRLYGRRDGFRSFQGLKGANSAIHKASSYHYPSQ